MGLVLTHHYHNIQAYFQPRAVLISLLCLSPSDSVALASATSPPYQILLSSLISLVIKIKLHYDFRF